MGNYEQKYKEALGRANAKIETYNHLGNASAVKSICEIFPELRESEDEIIRKDLTSYFEVCDNTTFAHHRVSDILAWLEKQGEQKPIEQDTEICDLWVYIREWNEKFGRLPQDEDELAACIDYVMKRQKPTDKVEPKFHAGDFITDGKRIFQIKETVWERNNRNDGTTYCESLIVNLRDGITYSNPTDLKEYHLWTIQDAKGGDVLVAYECLVLFKEIDGLNIRCYCTYHFMNNERFFVDTLQNKTAFTPATKEQCDLLFQKMKEAGYEWDAEKKELKKIEQTTWSKEDEKMKNLIIATLISMGTLNLERYHHMNLDEVQKWLKFLKERMKGK